MLAEARQKNGRTQRGRVVQHIAHQYSPEPRGGTDDLIAAETQLLAATE
ncbi:hypothetical protein BH20ACI3_BH20ACI3_32200 [soil metagenome]